MYHFFCMFVLSGAALFSLSGCTSPPKTSVQTVFQTKTVYQSVPEELTAKVVPPTLIPKEAYLSKTVYERESYLADLSIQIMQSLHSCNAQLGAVRSLSLKWREVENADKPKD